MPQTQMLCIVYILVKSAARFLAPALAPALAAGLSPKARIRKWLWLLLLPKMPG